MRELVTLNEYNVLKSESTKIIIDFHATWCGPCKVIAPTFKKLSEENPTIAFVKVDVDKSPEISKHFNISAMPTFISILNGEKKDVLQGANVAGLTNLVANL